MIEVNSTGDSSATEVQAFQFLQFRNGRWYLCDAQEAGRVSSHGHSACLKAAVPANELFHSKFSAVTLPSSSAVTPCHSLRGASVIQPAFRSSSQVTSQFAPSFMLKISSNTDLWLAANATTTAPQAGVSTEARGPCRLPPSTYRRTAPRRQVQKLEEDRGHRRCPVHPPEDLRCLPQRARTWHCRPADPASRERFSVISNGAGSAANVYVGVTGNGCAQVPDLPALSDCHAKAAAVCR